jgi:hypothetical protein
LPPGRRPFDHARSSGRRRPSCEAEAQAKDLIIAELRRPWWRRLIGG